jgi:putative AlgH/UPF0301 family transcriptional regulator
MKGLVPAVTKLAAIAVAAVALTTAARSADLSEPMILVASTALDGSPFEHAVVLATPFRDGAHIGFILNKPTGVKLDALFPDDAAVHRVEDSAYLGGPALQSVMFAVTQDPPESAHPAIPLMPGLVAVVDKDAIDHIIRSTPNEARYFLGVMVWRPGALEEQVDGKLWEVRPANADMILRAKSPGLWDSLRGPWANLELDRLPVSRTAEG